MSKFFAVRAIIAAAAFASVSAPVFAAADRDAALSSNIARQMFFSSYAPATPTANAPANRAPVASDSYIALSVQRESSFSNGIVR